MLNKILMTLTQRWLSLKITQKLGVIFILLMLISVAEAGLSLIAFGIVKNAANAAQTSLEVQRMSLEMSRDWEVMQNYQYRFFTHYQEVGFTEAKELYAIPAGETLSEIIRLGASLRRMTSASGASDNLQTNDAELQQYLADIGEYAVGLDSAVKLAADKSENNEQQIQEILTELEMLTQSIEPHFTQLILMAQSEVYIAQEQIQQTQKVVSIFLILANLFGIILIGLIIYFFNRNIATNVFRLTNASAIMQKGNLDERVSINSADEFGQIGAAFNDMADSIEERTKALGESEARYRELVTAAPYHVFVLQENRFVYANPAVLKSLNVDLSSLIGSDFLAFVHPEDQLQVNKWMSYIAQSEVKHTTEFRTIDSANQTLFLEIVAVPIIYNHKPAILGIGQDITQRRKLEKTMIETEKLAGIGTLAAGIAHEINSPLQVITGYSERIRRDLESKQSFQSEILSPKILSIERNAWRIAAIIQSLLSYTRPSAEQTEFYNLNDIVEDTLLLIEHKLNSWSNISIKKELTPDLPAIKCNKNRISQVLINLLNNAADAMPSGGEIGIYTNFLQETRQFMLQISDTGSGIPENLHNKIFDPFFTTKNIGEGTGLGLSIVRGIIEAHGGAISLQCPPSKGAIFTISLPQEMPDAPLQTGEGRYSD